MTHSARDSKGENDRGFTLIEMVIAVTLLALIMLSVTFVLYGSMRALAATRARSTFVEVANATMEQLRALPYDDVGVNSSNGDFSSAYPEPGNQFEGRNPVLVASAGQDPIEVVTTAPVSGAHVPFTIRRWITWHSLPGAIPQAVKRLDISLEWTESTGVSRDYRLTSILYPGGLGEEELPNQSPVAAYTSTPPSTMNVVAGSSVSFNATSTIDPEGDALSYEWQWGDLTANGGGVTATHVFTAAGTYTVLLTVDDGESDPGTATRTYTVVPPSANTPPTASFTVTPTSGVAPLTVSVNSTSTDPDVSDVLTFQWMWGDGQVDGFGVTSGHIYSSPGPYTLTLQVSDGINFSTTSQVVTATGLNCDITSGYFENPAGDSLRNDILILNNDKPSDRNFKFYAVTNSACSSVAGVLSLANSATPLKVTLGLVSTTGSQKFWEGTGAVSNSAQFSAGNAQTGAIWTPSTDGSIETFPITVNIHT